MQQNKRESGANESPNESQVLAESPKIEIELIRRPSESGIFGTVSFKVSITGTDVDETMRVLEHMTQKLETRYGLRANRQAHVSSAL